MLAPNLQPENFEGRDFSLSYFYLMQTLKVDSAGRVHLDAHQIYHWLVRRDHEGGYYYYTKPWKEKVSFVLPTHVVKSHDEGRLKALTFVIWSDGMWAFQHYEIYKRSNIKRRVQRARDTLDLITKKRI